MSLYFIILPEWFLNVFQGSQMYEIQQIDPAIFLSLLTISPIATESLKKTPFLDMDLAEIFLFKSQSTVSAIEFLCLIS